MNCLAGVEVKVRFEVITADEFSALYAPCSKIRRMLIASINTAKKNAE